jgi:hypothetical protein
MIILVNDNTCWVASKEIYFYLKVIFSSRVAIVLYVFLICLNSSFIHVSLETLVYVFYIVDFSKKIIYESLLNCWCRIYQMHLLTGSHMLINRNFTTLYF